MRYSLLSRFRGTLLGAAIAAQSRTSDRSPSAALKSVQMRKPEGQTGEPQPDKAWWIRQPLASAESLIRCGGLELSDWRDSLEDGGTGKPAILLHRSYALGAGSANANAAALAILPVILYYHEQERLLPEKIEQAASVWPELGEFTDGMLYLGYAISQFLQEKPDRVEEFPKTLMDILLSGASNKARNADGQTLPLDKIEKLCQKDVSLRTATNELTAGNSAEMASIALAFYCFLSTREDFRISVLRAARTDKDTLLTCVLTGALSGAYNGTAGIPVAWQIRGSAPVEPLEEPAEDMVNMGDRLFAAWSGAYDIENIPLEIEKAAIAAAAIAAP